MRGTPLRYGRGGSELRIIPAHAGNTAVAERDFPAARDHPRACGEHARSLVTSNHGQWIIPAHAGNTTPTTRQSALGQGSSPRMRGTHSAYHALGGNGGIIPAHAGNTNRNHSRLSQGGDHPRACGEHLGHLSFFSALPGSSPRMRGTPFARYNLPNAYGIIPAHAGNTCVQSTPPSVSRDHPRACGEHGGHYE